MTQISRDQRRHGLWKELCELVLNLVTPDRNRTNNEKKELYNLVLKKAEELDSVGSGYWGGATSIAKNLDAFITGFDGGVRMLAYKSNIDPKDYGKIVELIAKDGWI